MRDESPTAAAWTSDPRLDPLARRAGALVHRLAARQGSPESADALATTAALLVLERARGHLCVEVEEWAERALPFESHVDPAPTLPARAAWESALADPVMVGDGSRVTPLVRDAAGRIYLYRDHQAEKRLARGLSRLATRSAPSSLDPRSRELFDRLFPGAAPEGTALAAASALRGSLTVITGGPGTGKTTAVLRVLALLLAREPDLRIALAAPTGKAAARLAGSVAEQRARLDLEADLAARLPREVHTLHRLLGYLPADERFRHDAGRPLRADVVVVDEASMIDLLLMDALVDALGPDARLVLLGDKDQLASVDAGYVLGDIVDAAGPDPAAPARSPDFARWATPLFEAPVAHDPEATPLRDAVVGLTRNWRFQDRPGIAALAEAVRAGDAEEALAVLDDDARTDVERRSSPRDVAELMDPVQTHLRSVLASPSATVALERHEELRLLCALRRGPWGVEGVNRAIEDRLRHAGVHAQGAHYRGQPVLVTRNHPELALANGDVGVVWEREVVGSRGAGLRVAFAGAEPGAALRWLAPAQLPEHESAWALTVHKAQGSEYGRVVLVLPPQPHPLVTRELIYTAVTRARQSVLLVGSAEVLRAAIATRARRRSGLVDRLAAWSTMDLD